MQHVQARPKKPRISRLRIRQALGRMWSIPQMHLPCQRSVVETKDSSLLRAIYVTQVPLDVVIW